MGTLLRLFSLVSIRRVLRRGGGVLAIIAALTTCGDSPDPISAPQPAELEREPIALPEDEAPHDTPIEWWYFNGFLTDDTDNEYDFHYVVFQGPKGSFGVPHLVRITFGIPGDGSHHQAERLAFIPEESNAPSVYFEKDGWVMRGDGGGNYELAFNLDGIALSLSVSAARDPVLHYKGTGLTDFGPDVWAYYYSYTRQSVTGSIEDASGRRPVSGVSWYDHQWGNLTNRNIGWDWFGIQLDDGSDLMITMLRELGSNQRLALYGTYVSPEGEVLHLGEDAIFIESTRTWTSASTEITYPVAWMVESAPLNLHIEVEAKQEAAEFVTQVSYWEGAVRVSGTRDGRAVTGQGFAELVGYDPKQQEETSNPLPIP